MKKALKLALEALEAADWYIDQLEMIVYCIDDEGTHENRAKVQAAITAIKEALAQPDYRAVKTYHEGKPVYVSQPEQEPCGGCGGSGWVPRDPDIGTDQECFDCNGSGTQPNEPEQEPWMYRIWNDKDAQWRLTDDCSWPAEPIYTTPPKRPWGKPWVSLTDENIEEAYAKPTLRKMYQAIEAKLRELNT